MEKQEMKRPHFLVILLLSIIVVAFTFFLSPFSFSEEGENVVERGWPAAWASFPSYTEIPIIGPLLFLMLPDTVQFHWGGFLFDVAFFFGIFSLVAFVTTRRDRRGS